MTDTDIVSVIAELHYEDPRTALDWLAKAFGFATRIIITDAAGRPVYAETGWDEHVVAVVPQQTERLRSPRALAGANTQTVRMRTSGDVRLHCSRARNGGAVILHEPELFFFGDLVYVAADLEGHVWSFAQRIPGAGRPPPAGWNVRFPGR